MHNSVSIFKYIKFGIKTGSLNLLRNKACLNFLLKIEFKL